MIVRVARHRRVHQHDVELVLQRLRQRRILELALQSQRRRGALVDQRRLALQQLALLHGRRRVPREPLRLASRTRHNACERDVMMAGVIDGGLAKRKLRRSRCLPTKYLAAAASVVRLAWGASYARNPREPSERARRVGDSSEQVAGVECEPFHGTQC